MQTWSSLSASKNPSTDEVHTSFQGLLGTIFFTSLGLSLHLELRLFILHSLDHLEHGTHTPSLPRLFPAPVNFTFPHLPWLSVFNSYLGSHVSPPFPENLYWLFLPPLMLSWVTLLHRGIFGERTAGQFLEHQSIAGNVMSWRKYSGSVPWVAGRHTLINPGEASWHPGTGLTLPSKEEG